MESSSGDIVCFTAPGKVFVSRSDLVAHYKSDWHRYNLKRKVAKLAPVPEETFLKIQEQLNQRMGSLNVKVKQSNHLKKNSKHSNSNRQRRSKQHQQAQQLDATPVATPLITPSADEEEGYTLDLEAAALPVDLCKSIFDKQVSASVEANLEYMQLQYGFFIPDKEYVVDLNGLIKYCAQKVTVGKLCLFCDKVFKSGDDVVKHMISKSHCKIRWDSEEDLEELEDFYEFKQQNEQDMGTMEYLDTGEMLFTDANGSRRTIGTREFRRYYRQNYQPPDTRQSVVLSSANTAERLSELAKRSGVGHQLSMFTNSKQIYSKEERKLIKKQQRRQHFQAIMRLRDGMQVNLHVKNRTAKKNVGEGLGVHG